MENIGPSAIKVGSSLKQVMAIYFPKKFKTDHKLRAEFLNEIRTRNEIWRRALDYQRLTL